MFGKVAYAGCILFFCVQNVSPSSVSYNTTDSNHGLQPTEVIVDKKGLNSRSFQTKTTTSPFSTAGSAHFSTTTPRQQELDNSSTSLSVVIVVVVVGRFLLVLVLVLYFRKKLSFLQRLSVSCLSSTEDRTPAARSVSNDLPDDPLLNNGHSTSAA